MWYVYFLKSLSRPNWTYVGSTNNLDRRLFEHNSQKVSSTKHFIPLAIIYVEEYITETEARQKERYYKRWDGRIEKKNIVNKI
ncbi:MAG: GIY-YIG nuclease family protein [Minisyncoccota bacterium]